MNTQPRRPWSGLFSVESRRKYNKAVSDGARNLYDPANIVKQNIAREMEKHVPESVARNAKKTKDAAAAAGIHVPKLDTKKLQEEIASRIHAQQGGRPWSAGGGGDHRKVIDFAEPEKRDKAKKKKRPKTAH